MNKTTFNVIASYYHDEWEKMVPSHEYEGFETFELAMEQAEYHQAKGFDVQVYKCEPVEVIRLTGLDDEAGPEEDEDEEDYWSEEDDWNDDEYDIRNEWGEL